jgi:hypothetical protein
MTIFICNFAGCPNEGVEYNFGEDTPVKAECGGCHATLLPIKDEN